MGPQVLKYNGNVEHLIGEKFTCPRLMLGGGLRMVEWVVTGAWYFAMSNTTMVELDVIQHN